MAAGDRSERRFALSVSRLKHIFVRAHRYHPPDPDLPAATSPHPITKIDLGDLAVAQLLHDLRNQVTVMMSCADSLLVAAGQADQHIAELHRSGEQASRIARELLMAARPRDERTVVNVNQVITHSSATLACVTGRDIDLQLRLALEPVRVVARATEIERILLNLVLNARDALDGSGIVSIETAAESAPASAGAPLRLARLTVSDTGPGMTADVQERIFEPFFTTKEQGTGLGLSCVAYTVQQLGGTVAVQSRPGGGAAVHVRLPLAGDDPRRP